MLHQGKLVIAANEFTARYLLPVLHMFHRMHPMIRIQVMRTLAREVAKDGVTVNSALPGLHATARLIQLYGDTADAARGIPSGTVGDPGDFGQVVAFLCSDQAKFLTGVALQIDGGTYAALL